MELSTPFNELNEYNMEDTRLSRTSVPALDKLLGKQFKVLDDGFIRVIDYMGSDDSIVQAARVSYGKGTKKINEDQGLIRYLMRNSHTSPFEMCEIKFHLRVPMDCWRQWIRHRTASVNEYSTRYSVAIDSSQETPSSEWRLQSSLNKQGSSNFLASDLGSKLSEKEGLLHKFSREVYEERISHSVAREQARKDLPLSTYTEAYWKIDLHNLFNFLSLRMDSHAQLEIRNYANIIGQEIVKMWCPISWKAFEDYRLNSIKLSETELNLVKLFAENNLVGAKEYLLEKGLLHFDNDSIKPNRELNEIENKLVKLGFKVDWYLH